jgi:hypothetical protein
MILGVAHSTTSCTVYAFTKMTKLAKQNKKIKIIMNNEWMDVLQSTTTKCVFLCSRV